MLASRAAQVELPPDAFVPVDKESVEQLEAAYKAPAFDDFRSPMVVG